MAEVTLGVPLTQLVTYLDEYLRVAEIPDEPNAVNGFQVQNSGRVGRIVAAVDASQATIDGVIAGLEAGEATCAPPGTSRPALGGKRADQQAGDTAACRCPAGP